MVGPNIELKNLRFERNPGHSKKGRYRDSEPDKTFKNQGGNWTEEILSPPHSYDSLGNDFSTTKWRKLCELNKLTLKNEDGK